MLETRIQVRLMYKVYDKANELLSYHHGGRLEPRSMRKLLEGVQNTCLRITPPEG